MLTAGEIINAALRFQGNVGETALDDDLQRRLLYAFRLRQVMADAWVLAPNWFRHGDDTVSLTADSNEGLLPADFGHFGYEGHPYISGQTLARLRYVPPNAFDALENVTSGTASYPTAYTLKGTNAVGRKKVLVWQTPSGNLTLNVKSYVKRVPFPVDRPGPASAVDSAVAGLLNGTYTWRVTYVTADGETEPGPISSSLALTNMKATVTVPVSPVRQVTQRKLYRNVASGTDWKLVATITDNIATDPDNQTSSYTDNVADGSLGASAPTAAEAVSGVEVFPEDFHETLLVEGLNARIMGNQGDMREGIFSQRWSSQVRRMWAEQRPGQNEAEGMPSYGSGVPPVGTSRRIMT